MFSNTFLKLVQWISPLPELYLDTNVWIELAKRNFSVEKISTWIAENSGYVVFAKFQAVELCKSPQLVEELATVFAKLRVVMVEHWNQEIQGARRLEIIQDPGGFMELDLSKDENREAFIDEMQHGPIVESQKQIAIDATHFRDNVALALVSARRSQRPSWSYFDKFLRETLIGYCRTSNINLHPKAFEEPDRYSGLKLQYAVAYVRYFIHEKNWSPSDYLDLMHCIDMAYAHTVVTERALAEQIRQIKVRKPEFCPEVVQDMRFFS